MPLAVAPGQSDDPVKQQTSQISDFSDSDFTEKAMETRQNLGTSAWPGLTLGHKRIQGEEVRMKEIKNDHYWAARLTQRSMTALAAVAFTGTSLIALTAGTANGESGAGQPAAFVASIKAPRDGAVPRESAAESNVASERCGPRFAWANPDKDTVRTVLIRGQGWRTYSVGIASYLSRCGGYVRAQHQIYVDTTWLPYGHKVAITVSTLRNDGKWARAHPQTAVIIEGERKVQEKIIQQERGIGGGLSITRVRVWHSATRLGSNALFARDSKFEGIYKPWNGPEATAREATPQTPPPPVPAPQSPSRTEPSCHWKVTWPTAGVYDEPSRGSTLLKTKTNGEVVGPHCDTTVNQAENESYVKVHTDAALDRIGWMRRPALNQAG